MKNWIALAVCAAVAVSAVAQTAKPKQPATPKEIACPVMPSSKVNIANATKSKMFADYKGRRYFFCCAGCPAAFKANPARYAKAPSIPTPKKAKS